MAETLKFGDGKWAVKEGSTLAYNDENGNYKPLPFTFDRAGSATRVNKQGLIEVVPNNEPRIDFLNDSKGALLLEPSRSNLVTYSEAFDNPYWTKSGSSVSSGFSSPDGATNAFKLVENNATSDHSTYSTFGVLTSSKYTFSAFVKKGERYNMALADRNTGAYASFNLTDGTLIEESSMTSTIESLSNDWYKISITTNSAVTVLVPQIFVLEDSYTTGIPILATYTGDGTSGFYIYGAQVEAGSYPTSYIPTQGSIGTRVAESCSQTVPDGIINGSGGVLYLETKFFLDTLNSANTKEISLSNGSLDNSIRITHRFQFTLLQLVVIVGGVIQFNTIYQMGDIYTKLNKIAIKWKENDFAVWVNGIKVSEDTSSSTFANGVLTRLGFDNSLGGDNYEGNVKNLRVYNQVLTDAELQALTKI